MRLHGIPVGWRLGGTIEEESDHRLGTEYCRERIERTGVLVGHAGEWGDEWVIALRALVSCRQARVVCGERVPDRIVERFVSTRGHCYALHRASRRLRAAPSSGRWRESGLALALPRTIIGERRPSSRRPCHPRGIPFPPRESRRHAGTRRAFPQTSPRLPCRELWSAGHTPLHRRAK
jgi:hypothetical protein